MVKNVGGEIVSKIYLYGEVGYEITAESVRNDLKECELKDVKEVEIHLLTNGGDPLESYAIVDAIEDYQKRTGSKVTTVNDGYVASAGSNILVAGNEVLGTKRSSTSIHRAWTFASINSETGKQVLANLEAITKPSIALYVDKTGKTESEVLALMDEERWMTLDESIDFGLIDGVYEGSFNTELAQKVFNNIQQRADDSEFKAKVSEEIELHATVARILEK